MSTLYRDKANGKIMGVCAGIADHNGVEALWVRLGAIVATIVLTPAITIPAYIIAGLVLNKKPPHLYVAPAEQKSPPRVRQNPKRTARDIRARMKEIDRRLADVETFYVANNTRLSAEIEQLR